MPIECPTGAHCPLTSTLLTLGGGKTPHAQKSCPPSLNASRLYPISHTHTLALCPCNSRVPCVTILARLFVSMGIPCTGKPAILPCRVEDFFEKKGNNCRSTNETRGSENVVLRRVVRSFLAGLPGIRLKILDMIISSFFVAGRGHSYCNVDVQADYGGCVVCLQVRGAITINCLKKRFSQRPSSQ